MKIEFELIKEDYKKALFEFLVKEFYKRIILIFVLPFLISFIIAGKPFEWKLFLISYIISVLLIFFFLFGKSILNLYQTDELVKKKPLYIGKKVIVLEEDGIIIGTEMQTKYQWNSVNKIADLSNYIIIIFQNNTSITINKKALTNEEINNFIGRIKSELQTQNKNSNNTKNKNIYWLGIIGFVPNIGLIIGGILVYFGFKRTDNKLKLIGIANILFTPLFWFLFIQFTNNSTFLKNSNIEFTNHLLNEVVKDLEYYKVVNGYYPDSLGELRKQNKFFNDNEIFNENEILKENKSTKFYYKKANDDYILKSYGEDRILNTKDDIFPEFKLTDK